jgi:hypothetical protein
MAPPPVSDSLVTDALDCSCVRRLNQRRSITHYFGPLSLSGEELRILRLRYLTRQSPFLSGQEYANYVLTLDGMRDKDVATLMSRGMRYGCHFGSSWELPRDVDPTGKLARLLEATAWLRVLVSYSDLVHQGLWNPPSGYGRLVQSLEASLEQDRQRRAQRRLDYEQQVDPAEAFSVREAAVARIERAEEQTSRVSGVTKAQAFRAPTILQRRWKGQGGIGLARHVFWLTEDRPPDPWNCTLQVGIWCVV